jgi:hypothetical protein
LNERGWKALKDREAIEALKTADASVEKDRVVIAGWAIELPERRFSRSYAYSNKKGEVRLVLTVGGRFKREPVGVWEAGLTEFGVGH